MTTLVLAAAAALAVVPLVLSEFYVRLVAEMLVMGLFAAAFNLLLGYGGMLSFGHAGYYAVGAYTLAILTVRYKVPFVVAFLAAPVLTAAVATVTGYFCVRLRTFYFAVLTLAFAGIRKAAEALRGEPEAPPPGGTEPDPTNPDPTNPDPGPGPGTNTPPEQPGGNGGPGTNTPPAQPGGPGGPGTQPPPGGLPPPGNTPPPPPGVNPPPPGHGTTGGITPTYGPPQNRVSAAAYGSSASQSSSGSTKVSSR